MNNAVNLTDLATDLIDQAEALLAAPHVGKMNSSAQHCINEAKTRMSEGRLFLAASWARKSMSYSVGIFHPAHKAAKDRIAYAAEAGQ